MSNKLELPDSFSTIVTEKDKKYLISLLLTLSIYHKQTSIYILTTESVKKSIDQLTPNLYDKLDIHWIFELDSFNSVSYIIFKALLEKENTLFINVKNILLTSIYVDPTKDVGFMPNYFNEEQTNKLGYYNYYLLWVKNKKLCKLLNNKQLEKIKKEYTYYEFNDNVNIPLLRFAFGTETTQTMVNKIVPAFLSLSYDKKKILSLQIDVDNNQYSKIMEVIISKLTIAKMYKQLLPLYRCIHGKWIINIPEKYNTEEKSGFNELIHEWKQKNEEIKLMQMQHSNNIWILPNVVINDNKKVEHIEQNVINSGLLLLGNGDVEKEGYMLKLKYINSQSWIYWPTHTKIIEEMIKNKLPGWGERKYETIFIGNKVNEEQKEYRKDDAGWKEIIEKYDIYEDRKDNISYEDYLNEMKNSKYGLCLRGEGRKSTREIECMALGTIPIITNEIAIKSFANPPSEGIHYIRAYNPEDLKRKLINIQQKRWETISKAAQEWYMKNAHSDNSWNTTLETILYK